MKIGGLQKVSLIDYPGKISAVIFTQGCNFCCPYCHNPELVDPNLYQSCLPEKEVLKFLSQRRGRLDAVTITGGEPTIQRGLAAFVRKVRDMDFAVKLDSNGSEPDVMAYLIREKLIDYIALDVKTSMAKYAKVTPMPEAERSVRESIRIILQSDIEHEFRTTVVTSVVNVDDLKGIAAEIQGAKRFVLQKFFPSRTLNKEFIKEKTYSDQEFAEVKKELEKYIPAVIVR